MTRTRRQCPRIATQLSAVMIVVMTSVSTSHAQPLLNAADSAASARRLVREGMTAVRAGDSVAGHQKLVSATEVWPTQSEYFWTRARLAAAAHDTADVIASLSAFAAFGTSRSLATDRFLSSLAAHPRLSAVSAQLTANAAPLIRSTVRATLPDSTIWPEGVARDARARRFFVGSVRHRTVYVHDARGTRALWTDARANVGAILGVAVDPDGAHIWATTAGIPQMQGYAPPDSVIAALLKVRIADGTIVTRFDLPPTALGHTLGDVVVSATGDVFTSDSRDPVLYRLRRGKTVLEAYRDPLFRSLQGIAPAPDGAHVYVADYSHGLLRLNLATGTVTRLTDAPHTTSLGVDGLVWYGQSLIGVQNGVAPARIARFHLDATGTRIVRVDIIDRNTAVADEPTIGVIVGRSYVYVANSQWEKYDDTGKRVPGSVLAPAVLLAVPLFR
jgi:DNA-binding beta-propeller fold protein YncE